MPKHLSATQCASAEQALDLAHRFDERILVTGSLFLVGEILAILRLGTSRSSNQQSVSLTTFYYFVVF